MKKMFLYEGLMIAIFAILMGIGCSKDKDKEQPVTTLEVKPEAVTLKAEGETVKVAVTTGINDWTVQVASGVWCSAVREEGNVVITAGPNTSAEVLETEVLVKAGSQEKSIKVTQLAAVLSEGLAINIPENFKNGLVMKVLDGSREVAQICDEYIPGADKANRLTVVYTLNEDGKPDLSEGFVCQNGGKVKWDVVNNTCEYEAGTLATPLTKVYLADGKITANAAAKNEAIVIAAKIKDVENNEYKIVKIGTQYWMAENLRTTKYRDGSPIPNGQDNWPQAIEVDEQTVNPVQTAAYTFAYHWNNSMELIPEGVRPYYGVLYNWVALYGENISGIGSEKLAPEGWHVPNTDEWLNMLSYLKAENAATVVLAQKNDMPEDLTGDWNWMYAGNNLSGFTGFPGGNRIGDNTFSVGMAGFWWVGDSENLHYAPYMNVTSGAVDLQNMILQTGEKSFGCAVRCVKD